SRPSHSPLLPYTTLFRSISQSSGAFFVLAAAAHFARLLILVVVAQPRHPFAALLAAERCVIEEVVSVHEEIEAARICRVRVIDRSEEHTSELQSLRHLVC